MDIGKLPSIGKIDPEIPSSRTGGDSLATGFADSLKSAINEVDQLQKSSEAMQSEFADGGPVELHDVLIRVEEAEIAFKTMMEIRNKLVTAYQEVMRMGGG